VEVTSGGSVGSGLVGLAAGAAVGVPVQAESRKTSASIRLREILLVMDGSFLNSNLNSCSK
jgi:hypothetical protein